MKRKRSAMEALLGMNERQGKEVKQLIDIMGLETDEEAGTAIPDVE